MLKLVPLLIALPASALPASALQVFAPPCYNHSLMHSCRLSLTRAHRRVQAETVDDINPTTRNPTFAPKPLDGYTCTCPGFDYYSKDARSCADYEIPCHHAWPIRGSYCHDCRRDCGVYTVEDSEDCSRCWGKINEFNGKDCCGHPHGRIPLKPVPLMANCVCSDCGL